MAAVSVQQCGPRCGERPCSARSIARSGTIAWRSLPQPLQQQRQQQQARQWRSGCRLSPRCQAGGFGSSASSSDQAPALPNSREECIAQAAAAIAAQLAATAGPSKGFSGSGGRKLSVDVPVLESGPAALAALAQDILAALPRQLAKQFTVVSCADGASPAAGGGATPVVSLQQCVAEGRDLTGCLLIVAPSSEQLDATMRLLAYWQGPAAVVLNAGWAADAAPAEQVAFMRSIEACYCFQPLMVKVLFIGQEGAVFKNVTGGSPAAQPWRVFGKEGSRMQPIGRMQHRPTNADLEAVFYNAYAANNPLNKGIKALRGALGGGGKQQK